MSRSRIIVLTPRERTPDDGGRMTHIHDMPQIQVSRLINEGKITTEQYVVLLIKLSNYSLFLLSYTSYILSSTRRLHLPLNLSIGLSILLSSVFDQDQKLYKQNKLRFHQVLVYFIKKMSAISKRNNIVYKFNLLSNIQKN